ncbi:glutathione-disulfide reductase [Rehaibacterium terrae]|jgi:glutathione reductase (NADPH)|uniref:Glutathione reductase (NADPH) n=1 Tax=Rehaibacterium terrae TaxID=1341696 RepID=A0A7W8DDP6_9GAMM|nr:glutathione-disulfide reductase [Rehaibacterium terrae]MBB5015303.1 glutathione reductase (NADPH) [Rehaibacterium terrae]
MDRDDFDLIVLGAGSGGLAGAIRAARHGARVALLEPGALGGTCVNVGCVPKKAMWLAAELAELRQVAAALGFAGAPGALDWPAFVARREAYIANIHASYRQRLGELGIALLPHAGRFVAAREIEAGGRRLRAAHVLIATGARPVRPDLPGRELGIDSDGFFALRAAPRRVAIVGSGYIAVELGGVLRALGSEVVLFVRGDRLLGRFDGEVSRALAGSMQARGVQLAFGHRLARVERRDVGYRLRCTDGSVSSGFDELLWATGRAPNVASLGLDAAGVTLDGEGHVAIDDWQATSAAGVYAVGDVTARPALTPVAIAAARRLMDRLFGGRAEARLDYDMIPTVVFAHPPVGSVGLGEEAARERFGDAVRCYRTRFRPMLGALAGSDERTFMKLVCVGADERIVGLHVVGPGADEMLQGFAVALRMGARKADFDATVAIHPTAAEELVLL